MSIRLTQFYYFLPPPSSVILTDLGFKSLYRTRPIRRRRSPQFQLFAENKGGGGGGDQKDGERELFRWRDLLDPDPENILAVGLTALLGLASLQALWQLLLTSLAILLGALKSSTLNEGETDMSTISSSNFKLNLPPSIYQYSGLRRSYHRPTRTDPKTTCAIVSGSSCHATQFDEDGGGIGTINGSMAAALDLTSIDPSVQDALTFTTDLSPAPTHGCELRVAYQGVPGAYSEAAAGKAYPNCEAIPCDQFEVAFQAVELWVADRAVLPVENSLGGSIHRNYDLLLRHRLHIVGEVQLSVHHCLLALPGVRIDCLKRVISHPQALAQCEHTLTNKLGINGGVAREGVDDTAGAAEFVAKHGLRDTAVIASYRAAELYGLQILAEGIQDDSDNVTRFVMLAREPIVPRTDRPFKTSIVFAHDREGASVLFKVLSAFAFRDVNLTKIESRPHRNKPLRLVDDANVGTAKRFEYMFYADFEASMADVRAQNAISEIEEFTSFLRVLGSYPMDMTP